MEENFFTLVSLEHAQKRLAQYSMDTLDWVFEYWRLRRRSNNNQQLIVENDGEPEAATAEQRYRRITQLRTDLEKSRNLLCLIMKRERVKRQILRCDREIKLKEMKFLGSKVQLSEWTKSELSADLDDSGNVKTEADDAAQFLEDLDLESTTDVTATTKTPPPANTNNISKPPPPINKPPPPKFNQNVGQQKKIKTNDDKGEIQKLLQIFSNFFWPFFSNFLAIFSNFFGVFFTLFWRFFQTFVGDFFQFFWRFFFSNFLTIFSSFFGDFKTFLEISSL